MGSLGMTNPCPGDTCSELRAYLARELHDTVAGDLQAMLVELELLSRRNGVPSEVEDFVSAVRSSLAELRQVVRELRLLPTDHLLIQLAIDRKVVKALEQKQCVNRTRAALGPRWGSAGVSKDQSK